MLDEVIKDYLAVLNKEKEELVNQELFEKKNFWGRISSAFSSDKKKKLKEIEEKKQNIDQKIERAQDTNYVIYMLYESKPELFKNAVFMAELIKKDIKYIVYDMSNDDKLYKLFSDKLLELLSHIPCNAKRRQENVDQINRFIDEVMDPKVSEDGKYKIPHMFIYEALRKQMLRLILDSRESKIDETSSNYYFSISNHVFDMVKLMSTYEKNDCKYSSSFGEKIEQLYLDNDTYLCYAGVSDLNAVFKEGYQINYNGDLAYNFWNTHSIKNSFLNLFSERPFAREYSVYAAVPKNGEAVLGSDGQVGKFNILDSTEPYEFRTYLLPKYIVGGAKFENGDYRYISNPFLEEQQKDYKNVDIDKSNFIYYDEALAKMANSGKSR